VNWAYVPAGLLGTMLAGLLLLAHIAGDDPGFAVEADYYRKASQWDAEMAQRAQNERLGWQAELDVETLPSGKHAVALRLRDRAGRSIEGAAVAVEAFHNARASAPLSFRLEPQAGGYAAELLPQRPGLWEFRLDAQVGGNRFTSVQRPTLEAPR
jgi:nitrogen fixation protein FixH